jgi:hypothetical protein
MTHAKNSRRGIVAKHRWSVRPPHEREEQIQKSCGARIEQERFFFFRGEERLLDVIQLPVELPLYRINSYRTLDQQLTLIANGKYPKEFFAPARQEDVEVQQVQHEILIEFAKEGVGDDILPIWDELERRAQQIQNLLITSHGVVVNGNRRLSAMRELHATGDTRYAKFAYVKCAVLPKDATEDELVEIEIQLQMAPETKLPYSWITTARAMRDLRNRKKSNEQIEAMMHVDGTIIDREISKLDHADLYLSEWLGKPNDYSAILKDTQQAFNQIATRNSSGKKTQDVRDATRSFDFFLVEHRDELEDRAYDYINTIEGNAQRFLEAFSQEMKIPLEAKRANSGDLLDFDLGPDSSVSFQALRDHLKKIRIDKKKTSAAIEVISGICEMITEQKRNKGGAALKFAKQALQKLDSIDLTTASPETFADLSQALQGIEKKSTAINKEVAKLLKKK